MAHLITQIYQKVCDHQYLTDAEIRVAYTHFNELNKLASQAGPVFALTAKEAENVRQILESFMKQRNIEL